jgi:L-threonylcarbamoyladenylate synthase
VAKLKESVVLKVTPTAPLRRTIQEAATVLRRGGLVAFPTETVYGLGAAALEPAAVRKIFEVKQRPEWDPLIVHVGSVAMAGTLARNLPASFEALTARFWPGPLTLVVERSERVPDEVTAGRPTVALRMPRHKVPMMLLEELKAPIAAPSANRFGSPSPTRAGHVLKDLDGGVDLVLDGGPTLLGVESTVVDLTQSPPRILRPGGVSREDLESVSGPMPVGPSVEDERVQRAMKSPGLTAKHYSPQATVELFGGELHEILEQMVARAAALQARGTPVGAIASREMMYSLQAHTDYVSCFGKWGEWLRYAQRLFAALRIMDANEVVVILCPLPPAEGIGLAVRDRLLRAAGKETPHT